MAAKTKKEETIKEAEKTSKAKASSTSNSEKKVEKTAAVKSAVKKTTKKAETTTDVKETAVETKKTATKKATATKEETTAKKKVAEKPAKTEEVMEEAPKAAPKKATRKSKKDPDAMPRADISANNVDDILNKSVKDEKPSQKQKQEEAIEYINGEDYAGPRYSDEDLEIFKNNILKAKQEATEELRMLKERLDDYNNSDFAEESNIYSMHMAEQGPEALEQEKTFAQVHRNSEYIKKLDDALLRIKDKTYGVCRKCKCLIAKERLLAVPVTTLSASYKIHSKCPQDGIDKIEPISNIKK